MIVELHTRMLAANRSFYSLKNQFTSKDLLRRTKLGLYSTYIVPVLTYASETWTLTKSDETLLAAFERKMLRRILGHVCVEGDLTVVQSTKLARLRWTDHGVRMETDIPARKVFLGRPQGQRRRGWPKLRWQEGEEASAVKDGIRDWQTKARDRERFWALLKQAAKRL